MLDEGEVTLPMLVEAIEKGETEGTFRALERPDVSASPVPRFDLLKLDAYSEMAVQFFARLSVSVRVLRHYCAVRA